jgi:hypothetical protein
VTRGRNMPDRRAGQVRSGQVRSCRVVSCGACCADRAHSDPATASAIRPWEPAAHRRSTETSRDSRHLPRVRADEIRLPVALLAGLTAPSSLPIVSITRTVSLRLGSFSLSDTRVQFNPSMSRSRKATHRTPVRRPHGPSLRFVCLGRFSSLFKGFSS